MNGERGLKGDKGDAGEAATALEPIQRRLDEIEKKLQLLAWYESTFEKVKSSGERMEALPRFTTTPKEGWAIYGEPCHDDNGWDHQHKLMHNRQFDATVGPPDARPGVGDTVAAREFVTVWKDGPKYDDRDGYPIYGKEQYPPEDTAFGLIVPGQQVKITRVHPIKFGPTFVEFKLQGE